MRQSGDDSDRDDRCVEYLSSLRANSVVTLSSFSRNSRLTHKTGTDGQPGKPAPQARNSRLSPRLRLVTFRGFEVLKPVFEVGESQFVRGGRGRAGG